MMVKRWSGVGLLLAILMVPFTSFAQTFVERVSDTLELAMGDAVKISLEERADTAFISSPEIASYQVISETELLVFGVKVGEAAIFVTNQRGDTIYSATLRVVHNLSRVRAVLAEQYPDLDIKVEQATGDIVILSGQVPDPVTADDIVGLVSAFLPRGEDDAQGGQNAQRSAGQDQDSLGRGEGVAGVAFGNIINRLTITSESQVSIKVRVAEISRVIRERLGFQWGGLQLSAGVFNVGLAESPIFLGVTPDNLSATPPDVTSIIDFLAQENLISLLAEPNLSVTSGETASFLSGGEVPFPQVTANGQPIVQYKEYGILLDVTPTILSHNQISLRVRPEVSEPSIADGISFQGTEVPGIKIRRADTTIELASGQSFALAGLLRADLESQVSKFPGLADIPIIGALLRSSRFERGDTELVIVVTASIVRPTDATLSLPSVQAQLKGPFSRLFLGDVFVPQSVLPQGFIY